MLEQITKYWLPILAIILSVASFIYTLVIYRSNRRLATAQRFNYAMDKFVLVIQKYNTVRLLLCEISWHDKFNEYLVKIEHIEKVLYEVRHKYIFEKLEHYEKLNPFIIEKFISEINSENIELQFWEDLLNTIIGNEEIEKKLRK